MARHSRTDLAKRAGVDASFVSRLIELDVLAADDGGTFAPGDVRRATISPRSSEQTFAGLAARSGIPLELLLVVRQAIGAPCATGADRVREDELRIVPLIELQLANGFRATATERWLRVYGVSLRLIAVRLGLLAVGRRTRR